MGWNYYMNEFSAAIGLVQLNRLDNLNKKRQKMSETLILRNYNYF